METQERIPTVMVVDDTPANLQLIEDLLTQNRFRALLFPRGSLALQAASLNPPDIILLDIMMPEMDGFEVCRQLKTDEKLRDIPVIFISALNDINDKVKAFSIGAVDYIPKPFQRDEVLARIRTHIKLRQLQVQLQKHNNQLEELVKEKMKEISELQLSTLVALSKLCEYRDDKTGGHIERVKTFCKILAEKLKDNPLYKERISDSFIENLYYSAPLHDIGKVGIPDAILLKPARLIPEEFEHIKKHTIIGANTLETVKAKYPANPFINMGIAITRFHHEKWDGSGYPNGLSGEDIPLSARIMAIADVYDALRSKRPYKEPFSHEKSYQIIVDSSGKHFDPILVQTFISIEHKFAELYEKLKDTNN